MASPAGICAQESVKFVAVAAIDRLTGQHFRLILYQAGASALGRRFGVYWQIRRCRLVHDVDQPMTCYLTYLLAQADRQASAGLDGILREEGVSIEQWRILRVLSDGNGWTMGDLAEAALLTLPTLTRVTDRMVGQAFIYRATDPGDRRKVVIFLSDKGRAVGDKLHGRVVQQQQRLFDVMGADKARQLMALLGELTVAAEGFDGDSGDAARMDTPEGAAMASRTLSSQKDLTTDLIKSTPVS